MGDDRYLSNTVELKQSGLIEKLELDPSSLVKFGSKIHKSLFADAVSQLSVLLEELDL